jgi:hypothetical protein
MSSRQWRTLALVCTATLKLLLEVTVVPELWGVWCRHEDILPGDRGSPQVGCPWRGGKLKPCAQLARMSDLNVNLVPLKT